jgi:FMN-dependent NADH-azoreductase
MSNGNQQEGVAMKSVLVINSSAAREGSVSRALVEDAVAGILDANPFATVVRRDLGETPVPHLTVATLDGVRGTPSTDAQRAARALSDELLAELRAADTIVIGAPMYNFSLPSQLKAWIDRVAVAGKTFRYSENGPEGLAKGKKVIVASTRGGHYSAGPAAVLDHQESYLSAVLGFLGITDIEFVRAEGLNLGAESKQSAISEAEKAIVGHGAWKLAS